MGCPAGAVVFEVAEGGWVGYQPREGRHEGRCEGRSERWGKNGSSKKGLSSQNLLLLENCLQTGRL